MSKQLTVPVYLYDHATQTVEKIEEPRSLIVGDSEILVGQHFCSIFSLAKRNVYTTPYKEAVCVAVGENMNVVIGVDNFSVSTQRAKDRRFVLVKPFKTVSIDGKQFTFEQPTKRGKESEQVIMGMVESDIVTRLESHIRAQKKAKK